jgi:hypothetical protein
MAVSTVGGIQGRFGLGRPSALERKEPVVRYERKRPGELILLDVKKLGRFQRPGKRVRRPARTHRFDPGNPRRKSGEFRSRYMSSAGIGVGVSAAFDVPLPFYLLFFFDLPLRASLVPLHWESQSE